MRPKRSRPRAVREDGTYLVSRGGTTTINEVEIALHRMHGDNSRDQGQSNSSERYVHFSAILGKDDVVSFVYVLHEQFRILGVS